MMLPLYIVMYYYFYHFKTTFKFASSIQDFPFEFGGNQNQPSGDSGNRAGAQRAGNNGPNNNPWERRRRF